MLAEFPIHVYGVFGELSDENKVKDLISGIKDQPELSPYGASKWAVNEITDDFAIKLDKTGVRINMLDPGWLRTDLGGEDA
jgi:3-oxoacyl-[acyl-carrier protein] reductase